MKKVKKSTSEILSLIPTPSEDELIDELFYSKLWKYESVNKKLQRGEEEIDLYTSRGLFTQWLKDIPELNSHIAKDAKVVADEDFENPRRKQGRP